MKEHFGIEMDLAEPSEEFCFDGYEPLWLTSLYLMCSASSSTLVSMFHLHDHMTLDEAIKHVTDEESHRLRDGVDEQTEAIRIALQQAKQVVDLA